jgi:hypothetical protein
VGSVIVTAAVVDQAWEAYRAHAARALDDRKLFLDHGYIEQWAQLEARFKKLSLMARAY